MKKIILLASIGILLILIACSPKTTGSDDLSMKAPLIPEPVAEAVTTAESLMGSKSIPIDDRLTMGTLDNGIKYYIQKNQKPENRAELRLAVNAGSILEDDDQLGLAHFVEHMAFNGTENFEKSELVDYLESVGTRFGPDLNAYTSFDETVYMLQVRTDSTELFDKGMMIIKDWANGITFDHEEIDKERGVVESEWRTRLSPDQRMQNETFPVMYQDSRYATRLPIGDPDIINNADYETVKRFYKDWYRPDLMAVVVVGDVDIASVEAQIKTLFGSIEEHPNPRERKTYDVPMHDETLVKVVSDAEASFTNVSLMYKHDQVKTESMDDMRSSLVRRAYNGMLNARLSELTKSADPPFIYSYTGYSRDVGDIDSYSSFAMAPEGKAEAALEALMTENKRVLDHGFTNSELDRQKADMMESANRAVKEKDKTDSGRLAMRYVYHYLDENPIPSPDASLEMMNQYLPTIQIDEINALSDHFVKDDSRVVIISGPLKEETPLPEESAIRSLVDRVSMMEVEAYEDDVATAPFFAEELVEQEIVKTEMYDAPAIKYVELSNGVKVYLKKTDFKNDEILMSATSDGGTSLYSDEDYQYGSNATRISTESGISSFTSTQLEKMMAGKNVRVSPYIGSLSEGMSGSVSPDDMEIMFQMIYLYFTNPRFDEEAFASYINKQKGIYKNLMSNPQYFFSDYVMKKKYNNHPRMGWPSEESLDQLTLEDAKRIYHERFADASDFVFSFVGNYDEEMIESHIKKYLGNLPSIDREEDWKDLGIKVQDGVMKDRFKKGKAPKTNVQMYFHGPFEYTPENSYQMSSMMAYLRIKLREALREDKGGVYGVRMFGGGSKKPREEYSITISFNSDPDKTDELIDEAKRVIQQAIDEAPSDLDMTKVKETQKQGRVKSLKENRFWQGQIMRRQDEETKDFDKILMDSYEAKVDALTAEQIRAAAGSYFNFDRYMEFVMEPEELQEN